MSGSKHNSLGSGSRRLLGLLAVIAASTFLVGCISFSPGEKTHDYSNSEPNSNIKFRFEPKIWVREKPYLFFDRQVWSSITHRGYTGGIGGIDLKADVKKTDNLIYIKLNYGETVVNNTCTGSGVGDVCESGSATNSSINEIKCTYYSRVGDQVRWIVGGGYDWSSTWLCDGGGWKD